MVNWMSSVEYTVVGMGSAFVVGTLSASSSRMRIFAKKVVVVLFVWAPGCAIIVM